MISAVRNISSPMFDTTASNGVVTEPPKGTPEESAPRTLPTNKSGMGRDEFLKMLVAQLKNQDPMNPMDGKDMAAQLAQFSSVEQLLEINKTLEANKASAQATTDAITKLEETQNTRADEMATLIEGQMAMSTVGKVGVTTGNTTFVDRDGSGTLVIDAGSLKGAGKITMIDENGAAVATGTVANVTTGQQSFDLRDVNWDKPVKAGKYTYKFDVATEGDTQWRSVKTYTAGRITGMKYDQGNPVLILGNSLTIPMSQLTQIRS